MNSSSYKKKISKIRRNYNKAFLDSPESPLTTDQKLNFSGLSFFPIDEKYRLDVELKKNINPEKITLSSSKGESHIYLRYGSLEFALDGQTCKLTVFKPLDEDYFFLPFKDKTSGKESYEAGRYVEIELISDNIYILDFNLAYNPLCAYNDNFSCALTPFENILPIAIPAGQKKYRD